MKTQSKLKMKVDAYTTPNPLTVSKNALIEEVHSWMKLKGVRHLPVVDGEKVVGIISDRDVKLMAGFKGAEKLRAEDIMTRDPYTIRYSDLLETVVYALSEKKIGSAIVLDENGALYGIFTVTDALNALIDVLRGEAD